MNETRRLLWRVAGFIAFVSLPAHAEMTKAQCISANTSAQSLRREGKLAESRQQLQMCSDPKCPGLVVTDCTKRLDELESAQPTVVFEVRNPAGSDLVAVMIKIDTRPLLSRLDGSAVAVDPGEHSFTFEAEGLPPAERTIVIREGEKARHIPVMLSAAAASGTPPAGRTNSTKADSGSTVETELSSSNSTPGSAGDRAADTATAAPPGRQKTVGFVVTGAGVAMLAAGGILGYLTISAKGRQESNCASVDSCPDHAKAAQAHDEAKTNGTLSTVGVLVGAAATTIGVVLIANARSSGTGTASARLRLLANASPGSAGVNLVGAF
jgi:hypothetical protein